MSVDEVLNLLRDSCRQAGSQRKWASRHGVSAAYVSDVLAQAREPGPAILQALGIEKQVQVKYRMLPGPTLRDI
jgi:hypothetical protein